MSRDPPALAESPLDWSGDGQPRSRLYGDVYFSAEDGLAEARAVFLLGCGLPNAWTGRRRFVVGELGFGTGLNILALLHLWRETRPSGGRLHIFSVEAHPLTVADARRALAHWPELSDLAAHLTDCWPGQAHGVHRVEFPDLGVILDVSVGEVAQALEDWSGRADAWFLDGFSPALNPAMWRDEVLALVAARSAPGAAAATFTVAGQVRRGLTAAGFTVEKLPGFGRKRQRLAARLPGEPEPEGRGRTVAIIGCGIAGAAAARAVRSLGAKALIFEAQGPGAGASGNPAAMVTPRLDAGLGPPAQLFAQTFRRAVALYETLPGAVIARGVLQFSAQPKDAARFAAIAGSALFEPGSLERLGPQEAESLMGEATPPALAQHQALVVEPRVVLQALAADISTLRVAALSHNAEDWTLLDADGRVLGRADAVILAAGPASARLWPDLPLQPVRGQASWAELDHPPPAAAWGGYAVPMPGGILFGATHDRDDQGLEIRPLDHDRNRATLAQGLPGLAGRLDGLDLQGRASVRAATPDFLPLAGAVEAKPGLFVLSGFGSRGFCLAPLLAEHVAALALGAPSPLAAPLAHLVDPARLARRAARRTP